jgi:hypothetical protein
MQRLAPLAAASSLHGLATALAEPGPWTDGLATRRAVLRQRASASLAELGARAPLVLALRTLHPSGRCPCVTLSPDGKDRQRAGGKALPLQRVSIFSPIAPRVVILSTAKDLGMYAATRMCTRFFAVLRMTLANGMLRRARRAVYRHSLHPYLRRRPHWGDLQAVNCANHLQQLTRPHIVLSRRRSSTVSTPAYPS